MTKTETWNELKTATLEQYLAAIQAVLDDRAGKPTETAVRGDLLRAFDADWPEGWCWQEEESMWGEGPTDGWPDEPGPPDPERFYDLSGWELAHKSDRKAQSLWSLFKSWYDRREIPAKRLLAPIQALRYVIALARGASGGEIQVSAVVAFVDELDRGGAS